MESQAISASYIADLITLNEQALASFSAREKEVVSDTCADEWCNAAILESECDLYLAKLRKYHAFLVARENAQHQAERMTKSNSQIGLQP